MSVSFQNPPLLFISDACAVFFFSCVVHSMDKALPGGLSTICSHSDWRCRLNLTLNVHVIEFICFPAESDWTTLGLSGRLICLRNAVSCLSLSWTEADLILFPSHPLFHFCISASVLTSECFCHTPTLLLRLLCSVTAGFLVCVTHELVLYFVA